MTIPDDDPPSEMAWRQQTIEFLQLISGLWS
jgi:hypothetical protein